MFCRYIWKSLLQKEHDSLSTRATLYEAALNLHFEDQKNEEFDRAVEMVVLESEAEGERPKHEKTDLLESI